jgi:hypothetical protein
LFAERRGAMRSAWVRPPEAVHAKTAAAKRTKVLNESGAPLLAVLQRGYLARAT